MWSVADEEEENRQSGDIYIYIHIYKVYKE